jgi:flagellar motility protein MotE (MotC chaperone)
MPPPARGQSQSQASISLREEELSRREFELNRREKDLDTREQALRALEADVTTRIKSSEGERAQLGELIARNQAILDEQKALREQKRQEDDALKDARVEHLVAAFKGMKPEQAGALMNSMDDAVAVAILSAMPGSNAGKILANVVPDKAARLVKSISEQRIDPKVLLEAGSPPAGGEPSM